MKSFHFHTLATFLYASFALGGHVFFFPTRPGDIEKNEHEIVSHEYESGFFRKGTCSTPIFTSKKEHELNVPSPAFTLSTSEDCPGELVLEHSHVRGEEQSAGDVAYVVKTGNAIEVVTPSGNKMIVHKDGSVERWNKESGKWEPYSSVNGTADDIKNMIDELKGNGNPHGKGLFKEVLEAMSKCNIETKGAADEANNMCVTKKLEEELKKKKAAEKELLRQQQLAAQPKKSNAQQTKSNKKSNQVSTKPSKQTQSTQSKKTTKNTTQPAPALAATVADTTMPSISLPEKLPEKSHFCLDFEFVRDLKAMGDKIYRCTECGREKLVDVKNGQTIDDVIADNKERQQLANQAQQSAEQMIQTIEKNTKKSGVTIKWSDAITDYHRDGK